nr:hypothetical protein [Tanacetum cinerariifolium]
KITKVIKEEFEKLEYVKIIDVSLTCNTSHEIFNENFNRMIRMEDYLFTYEVEIAKVTKIPCDLKKENNSVQQMSHESDDDMEYDPSDVEFTECWKDYGYCNRGNLPGAYINEKTLHYQDLEWYEALKDGKLKEEALKNKAIMDGMIDEDDESSNKGWKRWDNFDNTNRDNEESENQMKHEEKGRCEVFDDHERPVCY